MSTFYIGPMCYQRHRDDRADVSDRDRQEVVATLRHHAAAGRMDADEYTARAAQVAAAADRTDLSAALGDFGPLPPSIARRRVLSTPLVVAAVVFAAVAAMAAVAAFTPLAFGFHPAFFWIVPLVGFKLARFGRHHHRYHHGRPSEQTISV